MAPLGVVQKLNAQMNQEFYASNLCLYYSDWCAQQSLNGSATVLRQQAQHNVTQMMRLFDYLKQTGANPVVGALKSVKPDCSSLEAIFRQMQDELNGRHAALARLMTEAQAARDDEMLAMLASLNRSCARTMRCSRPFFRNWPRRVRLAYVLKKRINACWTSWNRPADILI